LKPAIGRALGEVHVVVLRGGVSMLEGHGVAGDRRMRRVMRRLTRVVESVREVVVDALGSLREVVV
jgi:hypothetical protein